MKHCNLTMGYWASMLITLFLSSSIETNVNALSLSPWEMCKHLFVPEERGFRNPKGDAGFLPTFFSPSVSAQSVSYIWVREEEKAIFSMEI